MHSNLLNLPVELQLMIINELLQDQDIDTLTNRSEQQDEPIIIYHDLINWSCTCSHFRTLLAPNIFKITKLVNDEKSTSSIDAVAQSPHNIHVKELHFIGFARDDFHVKKATIANTEAIFPFSVDTLLADLQRFPSLERLSIQLDRIPATQEDLDSQDYKDADDADDADDEAVALRVLKAGDTASALRAVTLRTFYALTRNILPHFKHLEIRQLSWKVVSTLCHPDFHNFLGHLERFTLSIFDEGPNGGAKDGFPPFMLEHLNGKWMVKNPKEVMGHLDRFLFKHLKNVTFLSIKAPKAVRWWNSTPPTLHVDQMPLLKILHLDYMLASQELVDFLVGHKHTLEEVSLRNCYASPSFFCHFGNHALFWSKFFGSLYDARPSQLCLFEMVGSDISEPIEEKFGAKKDKEVLTIQRRYPRRIFFPYAYLDTPDGPLVLDNWEIFKEYKEGSDQCWWDRLMSLVRRNAKKAAKRERKGVELQVQS